MIMLGKGLALSGISLPTAGMGPDAAETSEIPGAVVENGVQNIASELTIWGYPDIIVKEGVPVIWNLYADENVLNGCNNALVIPDYDIEVKLKPGDNIIEFTPTESGTITYTC
jgi:plastocyanin domain-containing protein